MKTLLGKDIKTRLIGSLNLKSTFIIFFLIFSINLTVHANENSGGISLKSIVEGTGKIVNDTGDTISKAGKKIYEAEIPKEKLADAADAVIFGIGGFFYYIIIFIITMISFFIVLRVYIFVYFLIKYLFFNKNKYTRTELENEFVEGKFYLIFSSIYFLSAIIFFVFWVYLDEFPIISIINL